jgi:hypothetical protein
LPFGSDHPVFSDVQHRVVHGEDLDLLQIKNNFDTIAPLSSGDVDLGIGGVDHVVVLNPIGFRDDYIPLPHQLAPTVIPSGSAPNDMLDSGSDIDHPFINSHDLQSTQVDIHTHRGNLANAGN